MISTAPLPAQQVAAPPARIAVAAPDDEVVATLVANLPRETQTAVAEAFRIIRGPRERATERTARTTFESLRKTGTHEAVARLGLGLLDAREALDPSSYRGGVSGMTMAAAYAAGATPAQYARIHLHAALQRPETVSTAAAALVQVELLVRDEPEMRRLYDALRRVDSDHPTLVRARLELANALGDLTTADAVRTPAPGCGDAQLMRARAENLLRREASQRALDLYMRAVDCMTVEDAERFHADVLLLLTPAERAQWAQDGVEPKRAVLRDAWSWRAAETGVSEAERLAEHYRRLAHAWNAYSFFPPSMQAMGDVGASVNPQQGMAMGVLDQRAQLYLRHGEPDRVISSQVGWRPGGATGSNETWLYTRGGERMAFHFFSSGEKFVLGNVPGCSDVAWLESRAEVDSRLPLMAHRCRSPRQGGATMNSITMQSVQQELRATYRTGLATESQRQFVRDLPFFFELYRFAGHGGMTDVVAALAVPVSALPAPTVVGAERQYRLAASLIVLDTVARTVQRLDTVVSMRAPRALTAGEVVRFHITLPATPAAHTVYRVVARNPGDAAHGGAYGGPLAITRFRTDTLQISDLVLAEPQAAGGWRRGTHQLSLVPFAQFPGGAFDLFYEVYGVTPGARLRTQITLAPRRRGGLGALFGGGRAVELAFDHEAAADAGDVLQERRRLDANSGPGEYRLTVTVRNLDTGATTTQERLFTIPRERR